MIKFSDKRNWNVSKFDNHDLYYYGNLDIVEKIIKELINKNKIDRLFYEKIINNEVFSFFGFIFDYKDKIYSITDHCRSKPIFYCNDKEFQITNDSNLIINNKKISQNNLNEYMLSGYVSNNETLYNNLLQIEAGTYLIYEKKNNNINCYQFYQYIPNLNKNSNNNLASLFSIFNNILDINFKNIITKYKNNNFWIALSGGRDSALVLCKLIENGCTNITAYTYGSKINNDDAIKAKNLCSKLNIKWIFIAVSKKDIKEFISTDRFELYYKYVSDNSSFPNFLDFFALIKLKKLNKLNKKSIILNGHTGDYISGGHIPNLNLPINKDKTIEDLIFNKHYKLQKKSTLYVTEYIKSKIKTKLKKIDSNQYKVENLYEYWEFEERQSKFILNGQKNYDFLELNSIIPLWDIKVVNFFKDLSLNLKRNKKFYLEYLDNYNYKNVFANNKFNNNEWTGKLLFIRYLLFLIKILFGKKIRNYLQQILQYYGQNHYLFSLVSFKTYFFEFQNIRNPYSFWIKYAVKLFYKTK